MHFRLLGTNAFHAKAKNERLAAAGWCCRPKLEDQNFTSPIFGTLQEKLHQKACRTCSMIILPHSINQIIHLWCCRCHSRRRFLSLIKSATVFLRTFCTPGTCIYNFDTFDWRQLWNNEAKWRKFACQLNLLIIVSHFRFVTPSKTILIAPIIAIVVLQSLQSLRSYGNQS